MTTDTAGGAENLALGNYALDALTSGDGNVALGHMTLSATNAGRHNVGVGYRALYTNTTADNNVAVGKESMFYNTTGAENVAIGNQSLTANTTGASNVAIGTNALTANTTADDNVAIGRNTLSANTTGTRNIAIGRGAYYASDTENDNLAIGHNAMTTNTAGGTKNVAVGNYALDALTSGDNNTAVGYNALTGCTTANSNTAFGSGAGTDVVGAQTGVYIGLNVNPGDGNGSNNAIVIGSDFTGGGNTFSFGKGSNVVSNVFTSNATFARNSDLHKKTNIESTDLGLSFINELRPVTFNWKPSNEFPKHYVDYREENTMTTDINLYGMIAQEVESALDKVGHKNFGGWSEEEDGSQKLAQSMFIYPLINAVQELSTKNDSLETSNTALIARIEALENA